MPVAQELPIDTNASAMDMAETIFGNGVSIVSASYTGASASSGIYSNGDTVAPELTPADSGVILSTGYASSITNSRWDANSSSRTTGKMGTKGDSELSEIAGAKTYDAAIFEASFVPDGSTLTMQVTFSSEEYLEYVGTGFNDVVGIWVNGEKAELTVGDGDITINNINDQSNSNLYINNPAYAEVANTEMDGFTVTLTLKAPVIAGAENTIRIGIADAGDQSYDSNLLIAGNSIQCALVAGDDNISIQADGTATVNLLANDVFTAGPLLTITAINGQAVVAGSTIALSTGEIITLNPDGTITLEADSAAGTNVFTYEVSDGAGNTDTGFVTIDTTPCFTAGTLIETPHGWHRIETLQPGDLVLTIDNGLQPLRWIGFSIRKAQGQDAPIRFAPGALGAIDMVEVSPNHRVLYRSARAELLFGEPEVLVKAQELVNGHTITQRTDGTDVTYIHLLFDRHEIINANGLYSESYHPGLETLDAFDADTRDEVLRLMPGLSKASTDDYGPAARMSLRKYEIKTLLAV